MIVENGGYLTIDSYDDPDKDPVPETRYYEGIATIQNSAVIIDFLNPIHCNEVEDCDLYMLDMNHIYTREVSIHFVLFTSINKKSKIKV